MRWLEAVGARIPLPGKFKRRLVALRDYLFFVYGSEWKVVTGLALTVLGFVTGLLPLWVPAVLLVGTLLVMAHDLWEIYRRWSGVRLYNNRDHLDCFEFSGVVWGDAAGEFVALPGVGARGDRARIWLDPTVNEQLAAAAPGVGDLTVEPIEQPYRLPAELAEISAQSLRRTARPDASVDTRTRRPLWFNGRCARLMTEPTAASLQGSPFHFQPATYFDGQCSNELWHWSRDAPLREPCQQRLPRPHVVDAQGRLLSLGQARVANVVGITLMARTSDDCVLRVVQTAENSVTPGGVAASSSGSLDWADVTGGPAQLREVLMRGMLRELHEEAAVEPHEVVGETARVTSYFRWLSRGAKPEFTGYVQLDVPSDVVVARSTTAAESLFTSRTLAVPAELLRHPSSRWGGDLSELLGHLEQRMGGPVEMGASTVTAWHAAAGYVSGP